MSSFFKPQYIGAIKKEGNVSVKYKDITTKKIKTIKLNFCNSMQISNPIFANLASTLFQSGYYRANLLDDILFIQYNICADFPDMPMKEFTSRIGQLPKPKKVIVDLRHNTGGDSSVITPLIEMLKNLTQNEKIPLFVFIGNSTFSSGMIAVAELKAIGATTIGEEMGWNGKFGEVKKIDLTEGFSLFCSTKDFSKKLIEIHPDIVMTQDLKDLNAGIDSLVEAVKKLNLQKDVN